MAFEDLQALELYQQIERLGWDIVTTLRTFELTEAQMEALLIRIEWLAQHLPQMRHQFFGTGG